MLGQNKERIRKTPFSRKPLVRVWAKIENTHFLMGIWLMSGQNKERARKTSFLVGLRLGFGQK